VQGVGSGVRYVAVIALAACSPFGESTPFGECPPPPWNRTELRSDGDWTVIAWHRVACGGFPDENTEFVIAARSPGREVILFSGTLESTDYRPDLWLDRCQPSAETYACDD
jgi:hypothetical protein